MLHPLLSTPSAIDASSLARFSYDRMAIFGIIRIVIIGSVAAARRI